MVCPEKRGEYWPKRWPGFYDSKLDDPIKHKKELDKLSPIIKEEDIFFFCISERYFSLFLNKEAKFTDFANYDKEHKSPYMFNLLIEALLREKQAKKIITPGTYSQILTHLFSNYYINNENNWAGDLNFFFEEIIDAATFNNEALSILFQALVNLEPTLRAEIIEQLHKANYATPFGDKNQALNSAA